jgi:glycosyltransferase involved in cell wall biosynthesis
MSKYVLIGPGNMSIPPHGWGAVESIVWDYYENLKRIGKEVIIVNESDVKNIIRLCNEYNPDVVHIMYDDHIVVAPYLTCKKKYYMSHFAYITHPEFTTRLGGYYNTIFKKTLELQEHIILNAISDDIKDIYRMHGFTGLINVVHNGAREDLFEYTEYPKNGDKSIYVGKIEERKGQHKYQSIEGIRFVGNYDSSNFEIDDENYLGEWSKAMLYKGLTHYGNLVLLSDGEADPLVVKEGLMAGLGVVISECASSNLDKDLDFITIIPNNKLEDLSYISNKIKENRDVSLLNREKIREYALKKFAWNKIISDFVGM